MTGKELLDHLDNAALSIDIGAGDTVFSGNGINNKYEMYFNLLSTPVTPGENVDIGLCKSAQPYFSIAFSNFESFKVFSGFVAEFYQLAQEAISEVKKDGNNVMRCEKCSTDIESTTDHNSLCAGCLETETIQPLPTTFGVARGWECPKCRAVLAPNQSFCNFCAPCPKATWEFKPLWEYYGGSDN